MEKTSLKIVSAYSIIHFIVDFSCAVLMYNLIIPITKKIFFCIIIYNFFAFAMQLPIGIIADKVNKNAKCSAIGCALIILAYCLAKLEIISCIIAGIGNSMFHIGGGIDILNISQKKATLSGIFVSTGAIGIFLGSKAINITIISFIAIVLLLLSIIVLTWLYNSVKDNLKYEETIIPNIKNKELIAIFCLFITVCIRSYVGFILNFSWKNNTILAILFIIGVVLGKMLGGILGDRFGFIKTSIISLMFSAVLFMGAFNYSVLGIIAVLLFNITMPITLTSLSNIFYNNKGLAFGMLTFALFLGAFPMFFGYINSFFNPIGLFSIVFISAIILFVGLKEYNISLEEKND